MPNLRKPQLLDLVAVLRAGDDPSVEVGDVGTVVERLPPDGAEIEFLDRNGTTRESLVGRTSRSANSHLAPAGTTRDSPARHFPSRRTQKECRRRSKTPAPESHPEATEYPPLPPKPDQPQTAPRYGSQPPESPAPHHRYGAKPETCCTESRPSVPPPRRHSHEPALGGHHRAVPNLQPAPYCTRGSAHPHPSRRGGVPCSGPRLRENARVGRWDRGAQHGNQLYAAAAK